MKLNEIAISPEDAAQSLRNRRKQHSTSLKEVARGYKKNIKAVLDNHLYFFRVSASHRPIEDGETELHWFEQPARTGGRNSVFGNGNWLMSWVDSEWKGFPKRSMSYFATQAQSHAREFGRRDQMALIIPADDVDVFGWMPEDFNNSTLPQTLMAAIQSLLTSIRRSLAGQTTPLLKKLGEEVFISRGIDIYAAELPNPTVDNIKHYFEAIDELMDNLFQIQQRAANLQEERLVKTLKEFRSELKDMGFATLKEYADEELSPKEREAKTFTKFGEIKKSSSSTADELWFEGSYLALYWYGEDELLEGLQLLYEEL